MNTSEDFKKGLETSLLPFATDKAACQEFINEYCRLGRWNKKADELIKKAFPKARFAENIGLQGYTSGTVTTLGDSLIVTKCSYAVKSRKTGYSYNRSRAWILN